MARNPKLKYDIALSFAEEDMLQAKSIYKALKKKCLDVYFYPDKNQAGNDLYQTTLRVYRNGTNYGLVILSRHYPHKKWTKIEWQALLKARKMRYLKKTFIIRLDNTPLQGLRKSVIYIPWQNNPKAIAKQISDKIDGARTCHLRRIKIGLILFMIAAIWACTYLGLKY